MPKLRAKVEDEEYLKPETKIYRKYWSTTKDKLVNMVRKEGKRPSQAAKLLKIKDSTAKEILKNYKPIPLNIDDQKSTVLPRDDNKPLPKNKKVEKEEKAPNEVSPLVYVVFFYFILFPEANPQT